DHLLVLGTIAVDLAEVLHQQLPLDHHHPAQLPVVRVQRRNRPDRPADEHALQHVVAEDLVARVAIGNPQLVALQILRSDLVPDEIVIHLLLGDDAGRHLAETVDEFLNRNRSRSCNCGRLLRRFHSGCIVDCHALPRNFQEGACMKRMMLLVSLLASAAFAADMPTPDLYLIHEEIIKPGSMMAYEAAGKEFIAALNEKKVTSPALNWNAYMTDDF